MTQELFIQKLPQSETIELKNQVEYGEQQVSSMTLVQRPDAGITLFAVGKGEQIRKHTTPGDALVQVLDGSATITIGENRYKVSAGESIVMPAHIPHALEADEEAFKMLLIVIKAKKEQRS